RAAAPRYGPSFPTRRSSDLKLAADRHLHRSVMAERHDLRTGVPGGRFDLVSAHYLHTPFDLDRAAVLQAAAFRLRPGGRLLVVEDRKSTRLNSSHVKISYAV